jgi:hypothetical protein
VRALGAQFVERGCQVGKLRARGCLIHCSAPQGKSIARSRGGYESIGY